jgi:hypothetical protein
MKKFRRNKWFVLAIVLIAMLVFSLLLVALKLDFDEREDAVLRYFSEQSGMPETFTELENLTEPNAIVLCWWDYGRAVQQWSNREVIEAYPSRDIWESVGVSRDPWQNLAAQFFGTWGSSEKIHDIAEIFMLPEEQALNLMSKYGVSYALVFTPDDLQKFNWIAEIAGYNASKYLTIQGNLYQPTELGAHVTLLRLLFDETLHPQHFTKLFENSKGKIFRIDY